MLSHKTGIISTTIPKLQINFKIINVFTGMMVNNQYWNLTKGI